MKAKIIGSFDAKTHLSKILNSVDCSFSSLLFLPNENSSMAVELFKDIAYSTLYVPLLLWHETCNVVYVAMKRKRITAAQPVEIFDILNVLNIETTYEYGFPFAKNVVYLSNLYSISTYDAVYLDLALQKKAALTTFDDNLKAAAIKAGIHTIPAR